MEKAQRKILRSPSLKRKSKVLPIGQRLTLERVLGFTVSSNAALSCDPVNGTIAYPAGCVVVLFNPRRNRQSHIFNVSKKTITSVAFSGDGKHLVTGECGHQPAVRVWDVEEKTQVAEFHGHKFGINCVAFSPNLKYIVSIGSQHDMMVNVWNWKTGNKVASNKVSCKVCAVAFSADSAGFVTVGNRHVKFWYLDTSKSKINQTLPLQGRSGILGDQKNNFFCDVACGRGLSAGSTFVITQSGLLCEFNEKRLLDKWVELRTKSANCLTVGEDHIFVGCAEGVVRVFSASSLTFLTTLPHPHHLGVDVTTATSSSDMICTETDAKYPDTIAITIDDDHKKVTCIYNDHSLYVWDVLNVRRVGKAWSFLYHSGCIWAIEVYPRLENEHIGPLPPGSFITASSDDTIRVWNLETQMTETPNYKRNIYSSELLKIVYADPSLTFLCDVNYNPAGATDKTDTTWDGKNGVRSIRVSPDGEHLASGDRQGNVRVYDLHHMSEIRSIEAHESDVICLEYSFSKVGPRILASGSRDRLIHVFDVEQRYGLLQTLDDHSAAIQSVRFSDANNKLRMLSCGSDKSLLFRNAVLTPGFEFQLDQHLVSKATMYDMIIDPTQKFVATACQDRNIRVYNMATGKQKKNYRGSVGDEGVLLRVQLDPSGTYAATSCTDKNLSVLEFYTGELSATVYGHSEMVTGLRFTNDLKHLISVSADGCIFVWRLPSDMIKTMRLRMEELGKMPKEEPAVSDLRHEAALMPNPVSLDHTFHSAQHFPVMKENLSPARILASMDKSSSSTSSSSPSFTTSTPFGKGLDSNTSQATPDYRFSIGGQLPKWAKARFGDGVVDGTDGGSDTKQPKGRWAQRFDQNLAFKSQLDLTQMDDDAHDKRSSYLSGGVQPTGSMPDLRRETVVLSQHMPPKSIPIIDDDDETNVDDDDDFFPACLRNKLTGTPVESDRSSSDLDDRRKLRNSDPLGQKPSGAPGRRWGSRISLGNPEKGGSNSFDMEDTDDVDSWSDTTEVIYPPSEPESVDTYASTFKVFAVEGGKVQKRQRPKRLSSLGADDLDSESTDPVSLEDQEEEDGADDTLVVSTASTPSDPERELIPPRTPDKELFVKENFDSVSFTPVAMDKFTQQVASLERTVESTESSNLPFSPRLSLSSRFLSRSQYGGVRMAGGASSPRPDNWFDPLRKGKSEISRAMDETRRRLADMNWRTGGLIQESPEKEDPPSPPTKLEEPSFSSTKTAQALSNSGMCGSPSPRTLRRFWADFTLPHQPIKEEIPPPLSLVSQSLHQVQGDRALNPASGSKNTKIPLPSSSQVGRQATCSAELLPHAPMLSESGVRPRPPVSVELRCTQVHRLAQMSHDMKPVGLTNTPPPSTPPQSPKTARTRITSRPPRSPLSPDLRSPQSPRPPHSPLSPKPPPCPSSPRPPRSPLSCRTTRPPHSPDHATPHSPKPPRAPLSLRSPRSLSHSPDPKAPGNIVPPKKPPRSLPPLKTGIAPSRSCPQSPNSSAPPSPTPDGKQGTDSSRQPPKKPPRTFSSLRSRSSSPQSSARNSTTSPSPPPHPDRGRGRESVRSCCRSRLAQAKGQTSEVPTSTAGANKDREKSPAAPSPTQRVPSSSAQASASPTQASSPVSARERRRSASTGRQGEVNGSGNGTAPPVRQAPSYFRTTKSSRLKSASAGNLIKQADAQAKSAASSTTKVESGAKKRLGKGRLSSSRLAMYASTPNLAGFQEEDDDMIAPAEQTQEAPASNLRSLAEMSLSVPDINCLDDPTSTDSSSSSGPATGDQGKKGLATKSPKGRTSAMLSLPPDSLTSSELQFVNGNGVEAKDSKLMPPPASTNVPSRTTAQGRLLNRAAQVRKRSTSELTLEQAKSILLGNSGILGANQTSFDEESPTSSQPHTSKVSSGSDSSQRTLSTSSSTTLHSVSVSSRARASSSHTNSTSSTVFDPPDEVSNTAENVDLDNVYTPASTLAVTEEIERTAQELRKERERAAAAALGASRYDPPERDQPSRAKTPVRNGDAHSVSSTTGVVHFTLKDSKGKGVEPSQASSAKRTEEDPELSVRERVARYNSSLPTRGSVDSGQSHSPVGMSPRTGRASMSSPVPPDARASPRSQSDTGLGSDTDTDTDLRQFHKTRLNDTGSSGGSPRPDRSRLSLQLQPASTASPAGATAVVSSSTHHDLMQTCTSVLADLKMATQRARDLHTQVQNSTAEGRQQMMTLMAETFHETHLALAQLALQSPVASDDNPKAPSCPLMAEGSNSVDTAVMDKARDMLQPFVTYLSKELSDELVKLVKDRLEGNPQ